MGLDALAVGVQGAGCGERGTTNPAPCTLHPAPRTLKSDHRAVGGFFEEIPAFVVVVLAVSMFLVAA